MLSLHRTVSLAAHQLCLGWGFSVYLFGHFVSFRLPCHFLLNICCISGLNLMDRFLMYLFFCQVLLACCHFNEICCLLDGSDFTLIWASCLRVSIEVDLLMSRVFGFYLRLIGHKSSWMFARLESSDVGKVIPRSMYLDAKFRYSSSIRFLCLTS